MSDLPFSHSVSLADVPPNGLDLKLVLGEAQRADLARHIGVQAVPAFAAQLHIAPEGKDGLCVTGVLDAAVVQACGVTLEPFEAPVHEAIEVHFVPQGTALPAEADEDEDFDPPDEIIGGAIDVGALTVEFLALGVDPYPRKPGAVFSPPQEDAAAASPFAALSRLRTEPEG